jgi:hypothetical protein
MALCLACERGDDLPKAFQVSTPIAASTGQKPQSKLWYVDGTWWAALPDERGVRLWKLSGYEFSAVPEPEVLPGTTARAECDVAVRRDLLAVLAFNPAAPPEPPQGSAPDDPSASASLHALRLENGRYQMLVGFPIRLPFSSRVETVTVDIDSEGRIWIAYLEQNSGRVLAHWLAPDAAGEDVASPTEPFVLGEDANEDDLCAILAFSGQVGVFWSDQNADAFFFRIHRDPDPPDAWQPGEVVAQGGGVADDHVHLAGELNGRIWAVTKDSVDQFTLRRRGIDGQWDLAVPVLPTGQTGTRPIVVLAEQLGTGYVAYTDWSDKPHAIRMREFSLETGAVGAETVLLEGPRPFNNVTSTKQLVDARGGLLFAASDGTRVGYRWLPLARH